MHPIGATLVTNIRCPLGKIDETDLVCAITYADYTIYL